MASADTSGPVLDPDDAVRVFIRVRPLNTREKTNNESFAWSYNKTSLLEETQNGQRVYAYDRCYGPEDTNTTVYNEVGKPTVLKCMQGYNGTVFTYGQTGSGKTYSMRGCEEDPGMMMLCIKDIFDWIEAHPEREYRLKVSYLEVYNEEINDLLPDPDPKVDRMTSRNLKIISEDNIKGATIGNLQQVPVNTPAELMEALQRGEESRSYGSTIMNAESSRSHTIYRLIIEIRERETADADGDDAGELRLPSEQGKESEPLCISYLNLVDLAGSERQKSTGTSGSALKEGANINKSLLALGAVINKLGEASKKTKKNTEVFIPFRDSKLTRILKSSLGGNTLTSIICAVSPASGSREETVSTLKFGQVCKSIKNKAQSNEVLDEKGQIRMLRAQVAELKTQLDEATEQIASGGAVANVDLEAFMSEVGEGGGDGAAGSGIAAGLDVVPTAVLRQALAEKSALADRLQVYESLVGEVDMSDGEEGVVEIPADGETKEGGIENAVSEELKKVKNKQLGVKDILALVTEITAAKKELREQENTIITLKGQLEAFGDLHKERATAEAEIQDQIQGMAEESEKIAREREHLHNDRTTIMREREAMDEKESRLGMLLSALDERDSKLRQHMSMIQEQKKQWEASVKDLRRREDLVMDWQMKHSAREARLRERDDAFDIKVKDLGKREKNLTEQEVQLKVDRQALDDLDQRVQQKLSKCMAKEAELEEEKERVSKVEDGAKRREDEMEMKEREILFKRRELEEWDTLLREKDEKLIQDLTANDDREREIFASETKLREREAEVREMEHKNFRREAEANILFDKYSAGLDDVVARERAVDEHDRKLHNLDEELSNKEVELSSQEAKIRSVQIRLQDVDEREERVERRLEELEKARNAFYEGEVAGITRRHAEEMSELEDLVAQQLKIVATFQQDLDNSRLELTSRIQDNETLQTLVAERDAVVEKLKRDLSEARASQDKLNKDMRLMRRMSNGTVGKGAQRSGSTSSIEGGHEREMMKRASMDSVGFESQVLDDSDTMGSLGAEISIGPARAVVAAPKRSFLIQLAETQKMLERVLEMHGRELQERSIKQPKRRVSILSREQMVAMKAKSQSHWRHADLVGISEGDEDNADDFDAENEAGALRTVTSASEMSATSYGTDTNVLMESPVPDASNLEALAHQFVKAPSHGTGSGGFEAMATANSNLHATSSKPITHQSSFDTDVSFGNQSTTSTTSPFAEVSPVPASTTATTPTGAASSASNRRTSFDTHNATAPSMAPTLTPSWAVESAVPLDAVPFGPSHALGSNFNVASAPSALAAEHSPDSASELKGGDMITPLTGAGALFTGESPTLPTRTRLPSRKLSQGPGTKVDKRKSSTTVSLGFGKVKQNKG